MRGPGRSLCAIFLCILLRKQAKCPCFASSAPSRAFLTPDGKYSAKPNQDSAQGGNRAAFKGCFFHRFARVKERPSNQYRAAEPCSQRGRRTRLPAESTRER